MAVGLFVNQESRVKAQIIPDETLGAESSVVTPNTNINGQTADLIEGGATRGANLFHSFTEFNINEASAAYFALPTSIRNIFSRVTGSNPSHLFGTLGVLGDANLFFLNPNGIIFGPSASLDIRGSFVSTTADSFVFPDGTEYSTTNPGAPPLLTIDVEVPIGLQFGENSGTIINAGDLETPGNLTLVGATIVNTGQLSAPAGEVALSAVADDGIPVVQVGENGELLDSEQLGIASSEEISVSSLPMLVVSGGGEAIGLVVNGEGEVELAGTGVKVETGDVALSGQQDVVSLEAETATLVAANNLTVIDSHLETNGGDVTLLAGGDINISSSILASGLLGGNVTLTSPENIFLTNGSSVNVRAGGGGSITIDADRLEISEESNLQAGRQSGSGESDVRVVDIKINTTSAVTADDSFISNAVLAGDVGNGGDIEITTGSLSLTDGARVISSTLGEGNAGNIIVNATDSISLDGTKLIAEVDETAVGNGGEINITTDSLSAIDNAQLNSKTKGEGNSGNIIINATDRIFLDGSQVESEVDRTGVGNGGEINITTGSLSLTDGARLNSETDGQGNAGKIIINATDSIFLDGSRFRSGVGETGVGNAGEINITTDSLSLTNDARLNSLTLGQGNAGKIIINANGELSLTNEARLNSATFGQGNAGNVNLVADTIFFDAQSRITSGVEEGAIGNAGNISITTDTLSLVNGSQLETETESQGNAGNVVIDAEQLVSFDGGQVGSGVEGTAVGNAGNISITTETLSLVNEAELDSDTEGQGNAGSIIINADRGVFLDGSEIESQVNRDAVGNGGEISIATDSLSLVNGSQLSVRNIGEGDGGNLTINAELMVSFDGSSATSQVERNAVGNAGNITITTESLSLTNDALLSVRSIGEGDAGNLNIDADSILLDDRSRLEAQTAAGEFGNISLEASNIFLRGNSSITTNATGSSTGGNINIDTDFLIARDNSDISANAVLGNGGRVEITTFSIFGLAVRDRLTPLSDITATSDFGLDGTVNINTPGIDPTPSLDNLPEEAVNTEVSKGCFAGGGSANAAFFQIGSGGLLASPDDMLDSDTSIFSWTPLEPELENYAKFPPFLQQPINSDEVVWKASCLVRE